MTFLDIQNAVIGNTGRTDRLARIKQECNSALSLFGRLWPFKALRNTQSYTLNVNDLSLTLPADYQFFQQLLVLFGTSSSTIEVKNKVFLLQKWPNPTASGSGRPVVGYIDGGVMYFAPKANMAYNLMLHYYRKIPQLLADTDTILVPGLDDAVIAYASSKVFASVEQFDSAQYWKGVASEEYLAAKDADARTMGEVDLFQMTGNSGQVVADPMTDPFNFKRSNGNGW